MIQRGVGMYLENDHNWEKQLVELYAPLLASHWIQAVQEVGITLSKATSFSLGQFLKKS